MNTILRSILSVAMLSVIAGAYADSPDNIEKYFLGYLQGETSPYMSGNIVKSRDVKAVSDQVWKSWVDANKAFDEQKLSPLAALSAETASAWNLPADLEPNAVMNYYWGFKGDSISSAGIPLFIYMHGSGPRQQEWETGLKLAVRFDDSPSAYFIPQIPNEGEYYRWWHKSKQYAWEKVLRQSLASGEIDPDRVYMFGISEGAYGSQRLASFYADYIAGAGPMAGGEPLKNAPAENLRNTAFSLLTGDRDFGFYRDKLTRYTKRALDSLKQVYPEDYEYNIQLIPGRGHSIDYTPTTPWLSKHTRNPYPKHVSWENFEMDGRYRDGFYNLYVNERSNADESARTYYEMDIVGNTVNLTAQTVTYTATEIDPRWGIALDFKREYAPATSGSVTIYLNDSLVDLSKPVIVIVNGKKVFKGKLKMRMENIVNSCARYYDPSRLYPAAVTVNIR
ncbi:hypothetical protein [Duncaniella freteri]|uniref:hypothetical protein n=2 Tax=Duncaniella TaxID=2518495 RepID=UPI00256F5362|nr:hypothetical protein [Duncaniella freteri]